MTSDELPDGRSDDDFTRLRRERFGALPARPTEYVATVDHSPSWDGPGLTLLPYHLGAAGMYAALDVDGD